MPKALFATVLVAWMASASPVAAQVYIGQTITVPFNFCPKGWLEMNGTLLPIADYEVLFQLIGTTYGGDGQSTFALPHSQPEFTADGHMLRHCISTYGIFPSST